MKTATTEQKLKASKKAIDYVIARVRTDENIRAHMGPFTESFELLKEASALLNDEDPEEIEDSVRTFRLKRKSYYDLFTEIRDTLNEGRAEIDTLVRIREIVDHA